MSECIAQHADLSARNMFEVGGISSQSIMFIQQFGFEREFYYICVFRHNASSSIGSQFCGEIRGVRDRRQYITAEPCVFFL